MIGGEGYQTLYRTTRRVQVYQLSNLSDEPGAIYKYAVSYCQHTDALLNVNAP
jgi:hypothetical protein